MNTQLKIYLFFLLIGSMSCKKNSLQDYQSVYLTAAEKSIEATLSADGKGGELAISASSSQPVEEDVVVDIVMDNSLIDAYNLKTGKHYSSLPKGSYALDSEKIVIKKGTNLSSKLNFNILSIADFKEGVSYVMPITIKGAGNLSVLAASRTLFVIINKVVVSSVASLTNNYFTVDFSKSNLTAVKSLSMETKVMVNKFQSISPFISSIMGIEENFLLRFGDVTVEPNQLQVAGSVTATNVPMTFSPGVWYHVAAVYNGSSLLVYVDGKLVAEKGAVRTIDLTKGDFYLGRSAGGRYLDGYISEAKLWSKALSQSEIINGICGVDPKSEGIIGYWKFNEGKGNEANDVSGNGYTAKASRPVTWKPDVRCN